MSSKSLTTQEKLSLGLSSIAMEVDSLRAFVRDAPLVEDLERQLADKDAELAATHEELDDLRSELAGRDDAEHELERKIEELEGDLASAQEKLETREFGVADAASGLCDLIMQALGAESAATDNWLVYQIYRAVEDVRAEICAGGTRDDYARLKMLRSECKANSFVEQLRFANWRSKS